MASNSHPETSMSLRVGAIQDVAQGVRSFELLHPDGGDLPAFTAGSHIRVQTPSGVWRKYSLCNDPTERNRYVIAVKKEPNSQGGSRSMHEQLRLDDTLTASQPANAFPMVDKARAYIFIAGGIGITPILSMILSFGELPPAPWKLYYLSRSAESTAFLDVVKQSEWRRNVVVHHDEGDPTNAYDLWQALEKPDSAHVYCCGPRGLMESVRDMTGHWSPANVHFESFSEGGGVKAEDKPFTVELAKSGKVFDVPPGKSILSVVREQGYDAAWSCESGTCGTCRTRLLEGEADHRDMVLLPEEMPTQIMICVSRAKGERLVIDL